MHRRVCDPPQSRTRHITGNTIRSLHRKEHVSGGMPRASRVAEDQVDGKTPLKKTEKTNKYFCNLSASFYAKQPIRAPEQVQCTEKTPSLTGRLSGTPIATRSASLEHKFDPTTAVELHPLSPADLSLPLPPSSFARDIETRALPPSITSAAISPRDPGGLETVPGSPSPSPSATATPPSSITENASPLRPQSSA